MFEWPLPIEILAELDRADDKKNLDVHALRAAARKCLEHQVVNKPLPWEYVLNLNLFVHELCKDPTISERYSRQDLGRFVRAWLFGMSAPTVDDEITGLLSSLKGSVDKWCIITPLANLERAAEFRIGDVHFFVAPNSEYDEARTGLADFPTLKGRACAETVVTCGALPNVAAAIGITSYDRARELGSTRIREVLNLIRVMVPSSYNLDFAGGVGGYNLTNPGSASGGGTPTRTEEVIGPFAPFVKCKLESDDIESIRRAYEVVETIREKFGNESVDMGSKLTRFVYWLGEAARDPTDEARFLKRVIALETLLVWGGEGKATAIAERATFFFGQELKADYLKEKVAEIYRRRSVLSHSGEMRLSATEDRILGMVCGVVLNRYLSLLDQATDFDDFRTRVEQGVAAAFRSDERWSLSEATQATLHREILFQAWTAELAWKNLLAALRPPSILQEAHRARAGTSTREPMTSPVVQAYLQWQIQIWSLTRLMLSAAAAVSRILWPLTRREPRDARERAKVERAAELRRRWGLDPDSYLSDRDARDVFEHVDEKLLEWLDEHEGQPVQGLAMGEIAKHPELRTECFRLLDPVTKIVYAGTKECDLAKLFNALEGVSEHMPPAVHRIDLNLPSDQG